MEESFFKSLFGKLTSHVEDVFCFAGKVIEEVGDKFDPEPDPKEEALAVEAPRDDGHFGWSLFDCNDDAEAAVDTFEIA